MRVRPVMLAVLLAEGCARTADHQSARPQCGEFVCATVQAGRCGAIACLKEQPGEVYRYAGQMDGCTVQVPDCLHGLAQSAPPPSKPPPPKKGWYHGYSIWVEYLDREQYWIGEYTDYFPEPRIDPWQLIHMLAGHHACPDTPPP